MDNQNVTAKKLREIANEIRSKTKEAEEYISRIQKDASTVITTCNELNGYDGKGVADSLNYKIGNENANGETPWTYTWSTWDIKGTNSKKSEVAELNRKVANVKVVLMNLGRLAKQMQESADNISKYQSLIENGDLKDTKEYTVKGGDTLSAIARANGTTVEEIAKYNNIEDPNYIETGQKIIIPPKVTSGNTDINPNEYTVKSGDTLSAIARANGVTVEEIAKYNNIEDPSYIETGQKIIIPNKEGNNKNNSSSVQKIQASGLLGIAINGAYAGLQKLSNGARNYLVKNGFPLGNVSSVKSSHMYKGNIKDAIKAYSGELATASNKYTSDNMFMAVNNVDVNGSNYRVTHVVINDPSQIKVVAGNDDYKSGGETLKSIAVRTDAKAAATGSFFVDGKQNLQGQNNLAINNSKLVQTKNGFVTSDNYDSAINNTRAGGHEICVYKDGKIGYAPEGATAKELIDSGVVSTIASHEARRVDNGQIIQTDEWDKGYDRTYLCMKKPGEYYLIQGYGTPGNAVNYAKDELGCTFVGSLEQGSAVGLVADGQTVQNHDGYATIADALVFTDK